MEIILHVGAHRTAATSFQAYMASNAARLAAQGVGVWGPGRLRAGLLTGLVPVPGKAPAPQFVRTSGRVALACDRMARAGTRQLIVSDTRMLGEFRRTLRADRLYPDAGVRLARHVRAFGGDVRSIVLSIRSPELFWASAFSSAVARGHPLPTRTRLQALADDRRGWRGVIADLACAAPGVRIMVMTHEDLGGQPERRFWHMTGRHILPPMSDARLRLRRAPDLPGLRRAVCEHRHDAPAAGQGGDGPVGVAGDRAVLPSGDGRWMPFDRAARDQLRESYADDLFWLRSGADGLATLIEDAPLLRTRHRLTGTNAAVLPPPAPSMTRGEADDFEERRMGGDR